MRAIMIGIAMLAGCAPAPSGGQGGSGGQDGAGRRDEGPRPTAPARWQDDLAALEAQFRAPGVVAAGLGGTARLGNVEVRPLAIVEDSRCPRDVLCAWAGRARLRATITGVAGEPVLELGEPFRLPGGDVLIFVAMAPYRWQTPPPGVGADAPPRFAFRRDPGPPNIMEEPNW